MQVCYKKHMSNRHEGEGCDSVYSVDSLAASQGDESQLRCLVSMSLKL